MTIREVFISFSSIVKRKKQEMKFQASCLGATISDDENEHSEMSDEQHARAKELALATLKERGLKKWQKQT